MQQPVGAAVTQSPAKAPRSPVKAPQSPVKGPQSPVKVTAPLAPADQETSAMRRQSESLSLQL